MRTSLLILFCCIWRLSFAQPSPNQFLVGNFIIHADSGANTCFYLFTQGSDSVEIQKIQFRGSNVSQPKFNADEVVEINTPFIQKNAIYGINYLNSKKEEVYLYVYSSKDEDGLVDLHAGDLVRIESLDLKKGTYFIDWSSNQNKRFHRKISKNVQDREFRMNEQIDSLREAWRIPWEKLEEFKASESSKDSIKKYTELYESKLLEVQLIRYNFYNDNTKFSGYYETHAPEPFDVKNTHPLSLSKSEDVFTFVITQKAIKKQKISSKVIDPVAFSTYLNNQSKIKSRAVKKMRKALNYSPTKNSFHVE